MFGAIYCVTCVVMFFVVSAICSYKEEEFDELYGFFILVWPATIIGLPMLWLGDQIMKYGSSLGTWLRLRKTK